MPGGQVERMQAGPSEIRTQTSPGTHSLPSPVLSAEGEEAQGLRHGQPNAEHEKGFQATQLHVPGLPPTVM